MIADFKLGIWAARETRVAGWERELNAMVYELYGLTEEEIGIIEASGVG